MATFNKFEVAELRVVLETLRKVIIFNGNNNRDTRTLEEAVVKIECVIGWNEDTDEEPV